MELEQEQNNESYTKFSQISFQVVQLMFVNAALILLPSKLFFDDIPIKHWILYTLYFLFFLGGVLMRLFKYGKLSSRKQDQQLKSKFDKVIFIVFVLMVPTLHWIAMYHSSLYNASKISQLDFFCFIIALAAIGVNWLAANTLQEAYDRVVEPSKLVTQGIYSQCRHPIYSSYMMLFTSYCGVLDSYIVGIIFLVVCLVYYERRTSLEDNILRNKFGQEYANYTKNVKKYVPFVY